MGSIFPRGRKLWIKFKDETGEWKPRPTGLPDTPEGRKEAKKTLKNIEHDVHLRVQQLESGEVVPLTIEMYGRPWIDKRVEANDMSSAKGYRTSLNKYIYPAIVDEVKQLRLGSMLLDEVETVHIIAFIESLKKMPGRKPGTTLAPRTILNIFCPLRTLFEWAKAEGRIRSNPCEHLPTGVLPAALDKETGWRSSARYEPDEVELLIGDPRIPFDRRVWYAIEFIVGTRWGESCVLRWCDWKPKRTPLGALEIHRAWSAEDKLGRIKTTKTGMERTVPVHPVLAAMLEEWRLRGWAKMMGRVPTPEDLILPNAPRLYLSNGKPVKPETWERNLAKVRDRPVNDSAHIRKGALGLQRFHRDCKKLDLKILRNHDARRTTASIMADHDVQEVIRKYLVWGPSKKVSDTYTAPSWLALCREVLKVPYRPRAGAQVIELDQNQSVGVATGGASSNSLDASSLGTRFGTRLPSTENASGISVGVTGFEPVMSSYDSFAKTSKSSVVSSDYRQIVPLFGASKSSQTKGTCTKLGTRPVELDPIANMLLSSLGKWNVDHDPRRLERALVDVMAALAKYDDEDT